MPQGPRFKILDIATAPPAADMAAAGMLTGSQDVELIADSPAAMSNRILRKIGDFSEEILQFCAKNAEN